MAPPSRRAGSKQQGGEPNGRTTAGSPAPGPANPYSLATFVAPPAFVTPAPKETKEFRKVADGNRMRQPFPALQ